MAELRRNYVGELQEICHTIHTDLPEYVDESVEGNFKFACKLKEWVCHGTGISKKFAKQYAAKDMLHTIEYGELLPGYHEKGNQHPQNNSVTILTQYCAKEKKDSPLFSELPKDDGLFCFKCSLDGFTAVGKGHSKKKAKEDSASKVVDHFNITNFFDNLNKSKEKIMANIPPTNELSMLCQKKGLAPPIFEVKEIEENSVKKFKVICSVGEIQEESGVAHSKKAAKIEAATLVLQTLKNNTPTSSPSEENTDQGNGNKLKRKSDPEDPVCEPVNKISDNTVN